MKKLSILLNQNYKSFKTGFQYTFEGELVILSGVNGAGKSQIIDIIRQNNHNSNNSNININSTIQIDNQNLNKNQIEYRSFKENITIPEITQSTSQTFISSLVNALSFYKNYKLNPNNQPNYSDSCIKAKNILLKKYTEEEFNSGKIKDDDFKRLLREENFIWRQNDIFTNSVGEIFFSYALKVQKGRAEVGKNGGEAFDESSLGIAPWEALNNLFIKLKLDYRFKNNYEISGVEIDEQPKLFSINNDGNLNTSEPRELKDLSDGEKTIISLCFASLSGTTSEEKKVLLLDELDAVLNPSLIEMFFTVIQEYFIDKGIMVIMSTHSPATISLAPEYTRYYEVFKEGLDSRILSVNRDDYAELQKVNRQFYDKIENQENRIKELTLKIDSQAKVLILNFRT